MTEAEWLRSRNATRMIREWDGVISPRKLRLIGCGCYRLAWDLIPLLELRPVVELAERAADEAVDRSEELKAWIVANRARNLSTGTKPDIPAEYKSVNGRAGAWAAYSLNGSGSGLDAESVLRCTLEALDELSVVNRLPSVNRRRHAEIVRCVVGNPFRPLTFDPAWRTETAVALATGIYAERAFDRLPILADSLEEAGCDNADVLAHCRGPGPHARGCWVVDGLLSK